LILNSDLEYLKAVNPLTRKRDIVTSVSWK